MNRILALALAVVLLPACMGCAQRPAQSDRENDGPPQADSSALSTPDITPDIAPDAQEPVEVPAPPQEPEEPVQPEEPYVRVIDPSQPMVALTFDDGPHPVWSNAILDTLEANHGVATFFEVAVNIPDAPDALVRMLELGCEIGSHSNAHRDLGKLSLDEILQDLATADEAFIAATGQAPTLLRPPYGSVNKALKTASGRSVITWDVDTMDWDSQDAETVIDYVQSLEDLDGHILLMHSTYESTAQAVEVLVPWLLDQGYQLVTVSELFAYYYGELLQPDQFYGYTYFTTHGRTDTPLELEPAETVETAK